MFTYVSTSTSSIERARVKLPDGFDPARHEAAMCKKVSESTGKEGWRLSSVDGEHGIFIRHSAVTTVTKKADSFDVKLPGGTKPADGDKLAASLADTYSDYGVVMTRFEPFLGKATLSKMTEDALRCRGAVSTAIGVKPWEVQVSPTSDGGFNLGLPKTYVSSKHYDKLVEVATDVVGTVGWRVKVNPQTLTATFIPGDPPLFPKAIPSPIKTLGNGDVQMTPLGVTLPEEGEGVGPLEVIDWAASAWGLVAGTPGSGKTVLLSWLIAQQLADGASVAIIDDSEKSVDFLWAKPFLREHGWGCDSEAHAVTALALIYEEGKKRSKVLAEMGIPNWLNMPAKDRFQPIFVVVDELSALTVMDPVPKGVPKDHPIVMEINQMNFLRALISRFVNKIIAEQRFVGIRMVLSTQVTNASTGLPPSLKNKIGHRVLAGSNPSRPARNQAFNDESGVVDVPEHVKSSGAHARGVGVADLEGHASVVYKSFYADEKDYAKKLTELGLPLNKKASPTGAQVAEHAPDLSESEESGVPDRAEAPRGDLPPSGKPLPADSPFGPGQTPTDIDGKPLRGAAAAAKALKAPAAPAGTGPICPACDKPIDPSSGDCGCRW